MFGRRRCVRQWECCQTGPVRARCLHPDASGHLALARVLPYRRAEHISDRLSGLRRHADQI